MIIKSPPCVSQEAAGQRSNMGTPGLVRRVRVSFPGGSRDEPWVPLARTGGGWGTLLVAKDAESGGHSPLEGWLVGLAPGEGGRVCVCVCMCVCVCARDPWLHLHLAFRALGSHGRLNRVGGRNSAIRFVFLKITQASGRRAWQAARGGWER